MLLSFPSATLTAEVTNVALTDKPIFTWTVSSGKITSGQSTPTITISPGGEDLGELITVTVEVSGVSALTPDCNNRASVKAQFSEPFCPAISINCPTDIKEPGAALKISVNVSGGFPDMNLKYKWQVSAGNIISGQGTPEITVDTSETHGEAVTATVDVGGMPPECDSTESCSVITETNAPTARKYDEYGALSLVEEEARLVNLGIQLKEEAPDAQAFIIIYGARQVNQQLARARQFLVEKQGVDRNRIQLINGGYNKKSKTELWIVPTGATPPTPNPNF